MKHFLTGMWKLRIQIKTMWYQKPTEKNSQQKYDDERTKLNLCVLHNVLTNFIRPRLARNITGVKDSGIVIIIVIIIIIIIIICRAKIRPSTPKRHVLPCLYFSWSVSLGSSMIVTVFLFSYRAMSTGKFFLVYDDLPFYGIVHNISITFFESSLNIVN